MPTGILYKITVSPSVCRLQKADLTKKMNPAFFLFSFSFHSKRSTSTFRVLVQVILWRLPYCALAYLVTVGSVQFSSVQSLDRLGRRGDMKGDSAEILFKSRLWEIIVSTSDTEGTCTLCYSTYTIAEILFADCDFNSWLGTFFFFFFCTLLFGYISLLIEKLLELVQYFLQSVSHQCPLVTFLCCQRNWFTTVRPFEFE